MKKREFTPDNTTVTKSYYLDNTPNPNQSNYGWVTNSTKINGNQLTDPAIFVGWDFTTIWEMGANYPELR